MRNDCPKTQDCTPSWSILKIFVSTIVPMQCTQNDLKQNLCKTQVVNGVHPWISWRKFILSWPIILLNPRIVYHLEIFLKIFYCMFHNTSLYTQNDLKHNLSKTQLVNGVQPWICGLKFILNMTNHCPKTPDCTPSGHILKDLPFSTILSYALKMI